MDFSIVEHHKHKFIIFDSPTDSNLNKYLENLNKLKTQIIVRTCQPGYDKINSNIPVFDLYIKDGSTPDKKILTEWTNILTEYSIIGVHCVAGLGRAPLLVTLALINSGVKPLVAITLVRKRRPYALNPRQVEFVLQYRTRRSCCLI